jgi:hypothetical protein
MIATLSFNRIAASAVDIFSDPDYRAKFGVGEEFQVQ